jgi:hypothetical protein
MGGVPGGLAGELRDALGLVRAVETGTYHGGTTRELAQLFGDVVTIELSVELHREAVASFEGIPQITALQGDSGKLLPSLADPTVATLWFLDGHWSGGPTAGHESECPVLAEIAALAAGHTDDCVLIDDARLFAAPPPPPHDPQQWPTLIEVFDALRGSHPQHHVTVLADLMIAVPARAKPIVDRFGQSLADRFGQSLASASDGDEPPPASGLRSLFGRVKR